MKVRIADLNEFENVMEFYYEVIDNMPRTEYFDWERGGYPRIERTKVYLEKGELYVGEEDGKIICSAVLNHKYNDGYDTAPWQIDAGEEDTLMVHTLAVLPSYHGKGISGELVEEIKNIARDMGLKAVRLDLIVGNIPAQKLYERAGFTFIEHYISKVKDEQVYFYEFVL